MPNRLDFFPELNTSPEDADREIRRLISSRSGDFMRVTTQNYHISIIHEIAI